VDEIPFDPDRKRLSTVHAMPEGATLYCKGALESVLPLCSRILLHLDTRPIDQTVHQQILAAHEKWPSRGCGVLAFAYRLVGSEWKRG
jgi:sodium/potassium-transporting ATPase subunit alpha